MVFLVFENTEEIQAHVSISNSANINVQVSKIQSLLLLSDEGWGEIWHYVVQNYCLTWK